VVIDEPMTIKKRPAGLTCPWPWGDAFGEMQKEIKTATSFAGSARGRRFSKLLRLGQQTHCDKEKPSMPI